MYKEQAYTDARWMRSPDLAMGLTHQRSFLHAGVPSARPYSRPPLARLRAFDGLRIKALPHPNWVIHLLFALLRVATLHPEDRASKVSIRFAVVVTVPHPRFTPFTSVGPHTTYEPFYISPAVAAPPTGLFHSPGRLQKPLSLTGYRMLGQTVQQARLFPPPPPLGSRLLLRPISPVPSAPSLFITSIPTHPAPQPRSTGLRSSLTASLALHPPPQRGFIALYG
ncbi:hypothetical protein B0H16DRAFT_1733297 [Mycena metata]|uniref:Uncharacterized protein n=1 Tax=Mycena metata TaxID=1033252 RepID=A0AAD7I0C3_9AGAR|nr:hypothetical protein B0H16DRAFT_1733297 [Mycena metata]